MPGGVEVYVAKHREYLIKRMPDTGDAPTALHVIGIEEKAAKQKAVVGLPADVWVWNTDKAMPALPPRCTVAGSHNRHRLIAAICAGGRGHG